MYPNTHSDTVSPGKKNSKRWFILFLKNDSQDGGLKTHHNETLLIVPLDVVLYLIEKCPSEQIC